MAETETCITLFVDDSPASQEAKRKLEEAKVSFSIVRASGPGIPSARVGNTVYSGKWGIEFLAYGFGK